MKNALQQLPDTYTPAFTVDMQKNKKTAFLINALALLITVIMIVPVHFTYIPLHAFFDMSDGLGLYFVRMITLIAGFVTYIILHEAVHGITMKAFGCHKVSFGFTGLYAYAGSQEYFTKWPYIAIALAPIVVFGLLFALLLLLVPVSWFWCVYLLQIGNISGAAGDLYVTLRFLGLPRDIRVQDTGVRMTVYTKAS